MWSGGVGNWQLAVGNTSDVNHCLSETYRAIYESTADSGKDAIRQPTDGIFKTFVLLIRQGRSLHCFFFKDAISRKGWHPGFIPIIEKTTVYGCG